MSDSNIVNDKIVNIMLDLETLGTRPTSAIIAIGAYEFTGKFSFYEKINVKNAKLYGTTDDSALAWWFVQPDGIRIESFNGTKSLPEVLALFEEFLTRLTRTSNNLNLAIWGNGVDFDNVILANAYAMARKKLPWSHKQNRCYRTLKALCPEICYIKPEIPHVAINDAEAQAKHAQTILSYLNYKLSFPKEELK